MSKTNKIKELSRGEIKTRKRMYKAKKRWVVAGATVILGIGGFAGGVEANAWTATTVEEMATRVKAEDGQYTFQLGDTFWAIGQVINIQPAKLMELNGFAEGQQYTVPVGTVIRWDGNHVTVTDKEGNTVADVVISDNDKIDSSKTVAGQASDTPKVPVTTDQNGNVVNNNSNSNNSSNTNQNSNNNNNNGGNSSNNNQGNGGNSGNNNNGGNGNNTNPVNPKPPVPENPVVPPVTPDPEKPTDPTNPVDPEKPVDPTNPVDPVPPIVDPDPEKPTDPDPEVPVEVNKADLQALYDTWKDASIFDYTLESFDRFNSAMIVAKTVLENENATQAEVDTALANLQNAIDNLVEYVAEVNKSALETAIAQAEAVNAENYTEESINALTEALAQAKIVYENSEATQTEVNNATTVLANAIQSLIEKEPEAQTKSIVVNYVDENGAVLATRNVSGREGTSTTLTAESTIISNNLGFKLADSATKTVVFGEDETVTFNYEKDIRAVAVQAVAGDLVLNTRTVSGQVGTTTTVSSENEITFDGKTYESITQNEQPIIFGTTTSIIFNYVEKAVTPEPTQQFTVTVNHVDENGTVLATNSETVDEGTNYVATAQTFEGYTLNGEATQAITVNSDTTITFTYVKNAVTPPVEENKEQALQELNTVISRAENYYGSSNGSTEAWNHFKNIRENAKQLAQNSSNATVEQIKTMSEELKKAIIGLKDYSNLLNAYNQAKDVIRQSGYGEIAWTRFENFRSQAQNAINDYTLTQDSINTIAYDLNYAQSNLVDLVALEQNLKTDVLNKINEFRAENGLEAITWNTYVQQGCDIRAKEMFTSYTHLRPDGSSPSTAVENIQGYNVDPLGENIGRYLSTMPKSLEESGAQSIFDSWKNSGSHRGFMLTNITTHGAVGICVEENETGSVRVGYVYMAGLPFDDFSTQSAEISEETVESTTKESNEEVVESTEETTESTEEIIEEPVEETVESTTESEVVEETQESTVESVESTVESVESTVQSIEETVDKSSLKEAYDISTSLIQNDYSEESWNQLILEIANAKAVFDNQDATNYQVRVATESLKSAINSLA